MSFFLVNSLIRHARYLALFTKIGHPGVIASTAPCFSPDLLCWTAQWLPAGRGGMCAKLALSTSPISCPSSPKMTKNKLVVFWPAWAHHSSSLLFQFPILQQLWVEMGDLSSLQAVKSLNLEPTHGQEAVYNPAFFLLSAEQVRPGYFGTRPAPTHTPVLGAAVCDRPFL